MQAGLFCTDTSAAERVKAQLPCREDNLDYSNEVRNYVALREFSTTGHRSLRILYHALRDLGLFG